MKIWYLNMFFLKNLSRKFKFHDARNLTREKRVLYVTTNVHLWQYVAEFYSEWEIFWDKSCTENQNTHFVFSNSSPPSTPRKSCRLWDNVEKKYCRAGQATEDNTVQKTCSLHTRYLRLQRHTQNKEQSLLFHCKNGSMNAPQCYVICTWPVLFPARTQIFPWECHSITQSFVHKPTQHILVTDSIVQQSTSQSNLVYFSNLFVDCVWNVMAHAQKPDFVFRRNGRVHLNQLGFQFSRLLAAEVCESANAGYTMFRGSVRSTDYPLH